jgi:hypothetical protein
MACDRNNNQHKQNLCHNQFHTNYNNLHLFKTLINLGKVIGNVIDAKMSILLEEMSVSVVLNLGFKYTFCFQLFSLFAIRANKFCSTLPSPNAAERSWQRGSVCSTPRHLYTAKKGGGDSARAGDHFDI